MTTATGNDLLPVWSPDGLRLAYGSGTTNERRLSIAAADGTGVCTRAPMPGGAPFCEPTDWSPDGRHLIVNTRAAVFGRARPGDVWRVPIDDRRIEPRRFSPGRSPSMTRGYRPTDEWLAYVSEETGRPEVSVRAMSGPRPASRGLQQRRQPTRLAPRWAASCSTSIVEGHLRGRSVGRRPRGELTLGPSCLAEGAAHRSGALGDAVRRVAGRATRVLSSTDPCPEAERDQRRDRLECVPTVVCPGRGSVRLQNIREERHQRKSRTNDGANLRDQQARDPIGSC